METTVEEIKKCREGKFVLIDDVPSKVTSLKISKPGKHGEAKARLEAVGIFDHQKRIIVKPAGHKLRIPIVIKKNAQVIAFIGERVQLMDLEDYSIFEAEVPEDLKGKLKEGGEVIIWKFGNNVIIKGVK
ncbi:MAG: translation initiation factor IF-5A [Candidatus Aenigmatarchaeota archaeon]|nr:translation initiation factor IF-5A [Candidatus Aenigmarchaeota archaeon]RLJ04396.1 MAG: translation initiation factor IF-5A [Candidatus Aenigmarchaeota archaeon]